MANNLRNRKAPACLPIQAQPSKSVIWGNKKFGTGHRRVITFCIIGPNYPPKEFYDNVICAWGLDELQPRFFISINGGAQDMDIAPDYAKRFREAFVDAAQKTQSLVSTGGTNCGAMALIGDAMHEHDALATVPCIGILAFGSLKHELRVELLRLAGAPANEVKTDDDSHLAGLQHHHTHFVLVDNGMRGKDAFASELKWREDFEGYLSRSADKPIPRGMCTVNGGRGTLIAAWHATVNGCPIVACSGSGRASDFLLELKKIHRRHGGAQPELATHLAKEAWPKYMSGKDGQISIEDVEGELQISFSQLVSELGGYAHMDIYGHDDRRLQDVFLSAWCGASAPANSISNIDLKRLKQYIDFAVRSECKPEMYTVLGADRLPIMEILRDFVTEWREVQGGPLMSWLLERCRQELEIVDFDGVAQAYENDHFHWSGKNWLSQEGSNSLDHLYLWLVANGAHASVVDSVWFELEAPVHAALAAAGICRQTARVHRATGLYKDQSEHTRLKAAADRAEQLAVEMARSLVRNRHVTSINPDEYMERESLVYKQALISLAPRAGCRDFVLEEFYNKSIERLLEAPARFGGGVSTKPSFKAKMHWASRIIFTVIYSITLLAARRKQHALGFFLLLPWGLSLLRIEVLQIRAKIAWDDYLTVWNFLDLVLISLLLSSLVLAAVMLHIGMDPWPCYMLHAVNVLVCYLRLLQLAEWWEEPGKLLSSIFSLIREHGKRFLLMLIVISVGFSCPITAMLCYGSDVPGTSLVVQILGGFKAIFADSDPWSQEQCDPKDLPLLLWMLAGVLKYMLTLTSNILLINGLLLAMLNFSLEEARKMSKPEWALRRAELVQEFSSHDTPAMPPPFDLIPFLWGLVWPAEQCEIQRIVSHGVEYLAFTVKLKHGTLQRSDMESSVLLEERTGQQGTVRTQHKPEECIIENSPDPDTGEIRFKVVPWRKQLMFRFGGRGYEFMPVHASDHLGPNQKHQIAQLQKEIIEDVARST